MWSTAELEIFPSEWPMWIMIFSFNLMTAFLECFHKSRVDKIQAELSQALHWSSLGNLAIGRRELIVDGNSKAVSKFAEWFANPFLVSTNTQDATIVCQFRRIPLIRDLLVSATIDSSNFELICDAESQDPGEMVTATIQPTHCSPFNMSSNYSSSFSRQPARQVTHCHLYLIPCCMFHQWIVGFRFEHIFRE